MHLELTRVVQGSGRLGVLRGLSRTRPHHSLETPGCLLYTHLGSVPHLTQDTLHTLKDLPSVTQVTLSDIAEHQEVLESFKEGFRKFAGLHDTVLYCSLHDPAALCPAGYTTNKTVSVWGSGGRMELTVTKFMSLQKCTQPDWYTSMADGETWQVNTTRKRVRKSVDRTLAHLDECLLLHHKLPELEEVSVFGVVEGGDIVDERLRSARETAKRPVVGFCLDGFQTGFMEPSVRAQLIAAVTEELPEDKPRLLPGVGRPDEVLACVEAGVDVFEGFFPFQVTERGCALCFRFDVTPDPESAVLELNKEEEVVRNGNVNRDDQTQMTPFEINLKDKRYEDDFGPLVKGCGCYSCQNHQRAYLHHLLVTNELLAGVLLMIHNTSHYLGFFKALRAALASDQLELLKRRVMEAGGRESD
ncbi:queuine tRNA-ribosyltransferase accessory subunit 2 isoform X2 [Gouania willdenowi]|uniref:queuine tRNA-ribosyltransferase accessory subunit 2 isoform X2 n=1 Tax=Gouania willdenowi TaxID=441366 RepID=UPI0010545379|nr:queuine tRNA-ribosyltransferase accessory subunit 2 isoform X2 [Gouania willdenowi]